MWLLPKVFYSDYIYNQDEIEIHRAIRKSTSFRIIHFHLNKTGRKIQVLNENDIIIEFTLIEVLKKYEKLAKELLLDLIQHMADTLIYKKNDKNEIIGRLNKLLPYLINLSPLMHGNCRSNELG